MVDLKTLVEKLETENSQKRDLIVPAKKMKMLSPERLEIEIQGASEFIKPSELFETQMSSKLGIPVAYYRKMKKDRSDLLVENVNSWLDFNQTKNYLLRNIVSEEQTRGIAFLSDRYNIIDNYDVLFASL